MMDPLPDYYSREDFSLCLAIQCCSGKLVVLVESLSGISRSNFTDAKQIHLKKWEMKTTFLADYLVRMCLIYTINTKIIVMMNYIISTLNCS